MASAHVAHDCHVRNHTIFGNAATHGGHVTVEDFATISAFSGVHQFCRVGKHAFVGGSQVVTKDALPYAKTVGTVPASASTPSASSAADSRCRRGSAGPPHSLHSNTSRAIADGRDPSRSDGSCSHGFHPHLEPRRRPASPERRLEEVVEE